MTGEDSFFLLSLQVEITIRSGIVYLFCKFTLLITINRVYMVSVKPSPLDWHAANLETNFYRHTRIFRKRCFPNFLSVGACE